MLTGPSNSFENNFHIFANDKDVIDGLGFVYGNIFPQLLVAFMEKTYPFDRPLSQDHTGERTLSDSIIYSYLSNFHSFILYKKEEGMWIRNGQTIEDALKSPEFVKNGDAYKWFFPRIVPNENDGSEFQLHNENPQNIEYIPVPTLEVLAPDSNH